MDLPTILLILAAISIGATVIAVLVAFRSAREARTAIFPIVREEESNRARQARVSILVWAAITALLLGGWLASLRLTAVDEGETTTAVVEFTTPMPPPALDTPTAAPVAPLTPTLSPVTPTAAAANTPLSPETPTPVPAATTLPPTATPSPIPATPVSTRSPLGPAPAGASLGPIEFATQVGKPIQAINPGAVFAPNTKIYAVYAYDGMQNGLKVAAVWFHQNGTELARDEWVWEWGDTGRSYSFFLPPGPGPYKLDLYIKDTLAASGSFEIR